MSNEELVERIQAGERERLVELWEQVRLLVLKYARRWEGVGRQELDDLEQNGFIAVMEAAGTYDGSAAFTTWLVLYMKREFNEACGQRTERQRREPLLNAASLDEPLSDEEDSERMSSAVADPTAAAALEAVEEEDWRRRRNAVLMEAVGRLPEEERQAVMDKYWRQERVDRRTLNAALKRLRHPRVSRQLLGCP